MLSVVCPSHHLFFRSLLRKSLWLEQLCIALHADATLAKQFTDLKKKYRPLRECLSLGLTQVLDDTPVDSFLLNLAREFNEYESSLFEVLNDAHKISKPVSKILADTSVAWGREIAQTQMQEPAFLQSLGSRKTVLGLFETIQATLMGGEFMWKPALIRRYTARELEYEPRFCPHSREGAERLESGAVSLACQLEALVFEGYTSTLIPKSAMSRHTHQGSSNNAYCVDKIIKG